MRPFAVALIVLALVAAACGGDDVTETEAAEHVDLSDVVDAETLSAIDQAIDDLGPDGAVAAVVFALDDGYNSGQIVAAMADGTLGSDGSIPGVAATFPPSNLIDRSGPSAYGDVLVLAAGPDLMLAQTSSSTRDVKTNFLPDLAATFGIDAEAERARPELSRAYGTALIGTLMILAGAGYSFDQLVEHIVFGSDAIVVKPNAGGICPTIDGADALVAPARNPDYLEPGHPCLDWYNSLRSGATSASTIATESTTTDPTASTTGETTGDYSFSASIGDGVELSWIWTGAFSIVGDDLVGAGTVTGHADTTCSIEGGPEYPVAYTGSGKYDITGTAGESTMLVILSPTEGDVDVTVGDTAQLCVETSIDVSRVLAQFPMGNVELTDVAIELPLDGGETSLDFGGFIFHVAVSAG